MSHDWRRRAKCYELAEHVLPRGSRSPTVVFLAQQILDFVEDELVAMFVCEGCQDEYVDTVGDLCESCEANVREGSRHADPADSHGRP